ncbi:MAG: excinuclease ABC subunit UvrA [Longimicrobiales bacterium]|nr:excinuclease ABC subunit UvrA [Longimicrobiales bacterium]
MDSHIRIRGARQHNLKNLDVDLPRGALTVVTGPSGSGKSSLALDTLFAEGQRRYVESLSTYAKQFLDRMEKPDVDAIEGLAPAVAIEQKNPTRSSRSTVGTATEVYDYLRLLFARVGRTTCPECGRRVRPDTVSGAVDTLLATLPEGTRFSVSFPLPRSGEAGHAPLVEALRALGFQRLLADGVEVDLSEDAALDPGTAGADISKADEVIVIVDRLAIGQAGLEARLADSIGTSFAEGEGDCRVLVRDPPDGVPEILEFTEHFRCPEHPAIRFLDPTPQLFSFNNPYGSCPSCTGFGSTLEYDLDLIVPNPDRSIDDGAIDPWTKPRYSRERDRLRAFALDHDVSVYKPWRALPDAFREKVLHGAKKEGEIPAFKGVIPFLESREKKRYKQYIRVFLRQYQTPVPCGECGGGRVRKEATWVRVSEATIGEVAALPLDELQPWLDALELTEFEAQVAETIVRELRARVRFLIDVGLGYLALGRQMRTLSGGEAQRINLANSLGSQLVDTLYVLDEPTVGLHPRDTSRLLDLLEQLRDAGNTVVVVEHDTEAIERADHIVELGPESGEKGGELVYEGPPSELRERDTATGRYLSGASAIRAPARRRATDHGWLELKGARLHNVEGVDLRIPLGTLTTVTGVSGSGKSTLVHDVLYRALEKELGDGETSAKEHLGEAIGRYDRLDGATRIDEVLLVDQSPIGRTPRSNPVTYLKAWGEIRKLFAEQPLARTRRYKPGIFSFNTDGGRCEACKGAGHVEIEMVFMADVYVPCDVCHGSRYKAEVLEVTLEGRTIADVLELTVDEALRFFMRERKLGQTLWHLQQVGLGYLRLGQPAPTLSGGEAQRLKIARELAGGSGGKGRRLYLLDEPTTGLSGEDIAKLVHVLDKLVDQGHTVLVIEHNLDLIKVSDWVIDLGPEAGAGGGRLVAEGRPEEVAGVEASWTGRYLKGVL